jgi:hypothetical protein
MKMELFRRERAAPATTSESIASIHYIVSLVAPLLLVACVISLSLLLLVVVE